MLLIKKCAFFCYVLPCSLTVIVEVAIVVIKVLYHYFLILYLGKYCSFQMIPFKDSQINLLKGMQINELGGLMQREGTGLGTFTKLLFLVQIQHWCIVLIMIQCNL